MKFKVNKKELEGALDLLQKYIKNMIDNGKDFPKDDLYIVIRYGTMVFFEIGKGSNAKPISYFHINKDVDNNEEVVIMDVMQLSEMMKSCFAKIGVVV